MNEVKGNVKAFILGGRSEFTILQDPVGAKKGVSYRYYVKKNDSGTCWYVYTETGIKREVKYQGYLKRDMSFNVGEKGNPNYNIDAVKGLQWVLSRSESLPNSVHVLHHGKCSVCGRKLTDAESLRTGMGPKCREKVGF